MNKLDKATASNRGDVMRIGYALLFLVGIVLFISSQVGDIPNSYVLVIAAMIGGYMAMNIGLMQERADQLGLELMSQNNRSRHQTAFTVSIEAREGISTGISAHDRSKTVSVAIDPTKSMQDIVSPGHISRWSPVMAAC